MRYVLCTIYGFVGALLCAIPNLTRRELLFAVPMPPEFRETDAGRHAISAFRTVIACVSATGICVLLLSPPRLLNAVANIVPVAILLAGVFSFIWQNRRLAPFAVQFARPRDAELTDLPEKLPQFVWLAVGPLAILAAAAR